MNMHALRLSRHSDQRISTSEMIMASPSRASTSMRRIWACAGALLAATALADEGRLDSLLPSLQQGGYVIVLRHGATDPRQQDAYPLNYEDMMGQRQLSEQGKEVARQMGAALSTLGIPIGKVFTSRLNRAVETGRLVAGKDVIWNEELNDSGMGSVSAMGGSSATGNQRSAAALRQLAATRPAFHTNTLIVTHKTNIQDAFGQMGADIKEGESLLFKPDGVGSPTPIARVKASDWIVLVRGRISIGVMR
jgi:broad specificity phosphatase PhoE